MSIHHYSQILLLALVSSLAPSTATGQSMGKRTVNLDLQISYRMPKKLVRIPLNSAGMHPALKDRWEYVVDDKVKSKKTKKKKKVKDPVPDLAWGVQVLAFGTQKRETPTTIGNSGEKDKAKQAKPQKKGAKEGQPRMRYKTYRNFDDFLRKSSRGARFAERGVERKQGSGRRLPYHYYAWTEGVQSFRCAVYKKDGKEIALYGYYLKYPYELTKKATKIYEKQIRDREKGLKKAIESLVWERGRHYQEQGVRGEHRYATTPLRKKILAAEKKSIAGYADWDIFCTKNFIIKYSFDKGKGKKDDAYRFSERMARQMADMLLQYQKYFPPHAKMTKWWSVLRICRNHDEFSKYGSTHPGVIGWFNPKSLELVIFRSKRWSEAVAYHEGWHQYAHFWFGGKVTLHRWYDEGLGDFFGSMARKSNHRFDLQSSRMRLATIKKLVRDGKTVPLKDLVRWNKRKFYGPKAGFYYAQGWSVVDFLMRGKDSPHFKPAYAKIMSTYTKVCLKTGDQKKAVEAAFKGMDWMTFEKDWKAYVQDLE